jgi:hypothetical protein
LDSGFQFAQGSEELVAFGFDLDQFHGALSSNRQ